MTLIEDVGYMWKDAAAIGIIGVPTQEDIPMLEKQLGQPVKRVEKRGEVILIIGKGLWKKKIRLTCS